MRTNAFDDTNEQRAATKNESKEKIGKMNAKHIRAPCSSHLVACARATDSERERESHEQTNHRNDRTRRSPGSAHSSCKFLFYL